MLALADPAAGAAVDTAREMFQFEGYTLDVARGLRTADREVELRPKSFEVLHYLLQSDGRLVTKDEIIKSVWPNVVVTDESLAQCISEVRQAIGDSGQAIIKTVPRRGYRFVAPVSQPHPQAAPPTAGATPAVGAQVGARLDEQIEPRLPDRPSVAVLPFANLNGNPKQDYFSDGITEDIITELSRFSELLVIARNSTFQYKGRAVDIRQVGRELGARYLLEGSMRRERDRVRITAQLIDTSTGGHLWAERYDRKLSDVFAVQDEVARAIAAILAAHVNKAEAERTLLKPPASWEAYDYYMRATGSHLTFPHGRSSRAIRETRHYLEKCLSLDPNYARAYAILSRTYWYTYAEPVDDDYLSPAGLERAHDLAKRAAQLAPNLPETHAQLGWVLLYKRQHEASIAAFEHSFALNPNYNDNRFILLLGFAGEPARAIEALRANTSRDPFHPFGTFGWLGHAYYMLRRYREAAQTLRVYPSRAPNIRILPLWLAAAYAQLGELAEARSEAAEVLRIEPDFTIGRWKCVAPYRNLDDAEHLFDGLRKAGLPES